MGIFGRDSSVIDRNICWSEELERVRIHCRSDAEHTEYLRCSSLVFTAEVS